MMRSGRGQCRADLRVEARFLVRVGGSPRRAQRESNSSMNANRTREDASIHGLAIGRRQRSCRLAAQSQPRLASSCRIPFCSHVPSQSIPSSALCSQACQVPIQNSRRSSRPNWPSWLRWPGSGLSWVVRRRRVDLRDKLERRFGVVLHERLAGKVLAKLGPSALGRPRHPQADESVSLIRRP